MVVNLNRPSIVRATGFSNYSNNMKTQQTTISEVMRVYRTKVQAPESLRVNNQSIHPTDFLFPRRIVIPVSLIPGILLMSLMPITLSSIPLISISALVKWVTGKNGQ